MGYRKSHHRRAHTRTNANGSQSYVRDTEVKGHNCRSEKQRSNSYESNSVDEWLATLAFAGFTLFILGLILRWDDTVFFLMVFIIPALILLMKNK